MKERGQNVSINCTADGVPVPTIVWRKDGQLIIPSSRRSTSSKNYPGFRSNITGTTSTLTITDLTGSDNGTYSCRALNEANIGVVLDTPYQLTVVACKCYTIMFDVINLRHCIHD